MTEIQEICLETRDDLIQLIKSTKYQFVVLKFKAMWCRPCKVIQPFVHTLVNEKCKELNAKQKKDIFLYVDVDVDECVDLYAFLKKSKRINGIPAIFLYSKEITKNMDDDYIYIPHASVSGTKERDIQKLFDLIQ